AALADDPSARVRFQAALSLGEARFPESAGALARIIRRDVADPWAVTAVLSSSRRFATELLESLTSDREFMGNASAERVEVIVRLARVAGGSSSDTELARVLNLLPTNSQAAEPWQLALLDGLGQGLRGVLSSPARIWEKPSPVLEAGVVRARP